MKINVNLEKLGGVLLAFSGPLLAYEMHARHADEALLLAGNVDDPFSALGMIAFLYAVGTMVIGAIMATRD